MPKPHSSTAWVHAIVNFIVGAFLGACVGISMWAFDISDTLIGAGVTVAMAVLCGVLAAIYGDRFWKSFQDGSSWNPLNWW